MFTLQLYNCRYGLVSLNKQNKINDKLSNLINNIEVN